MKRHPERIICFMLACAATALAACGSVSREDNSEGVKTLPRTYPMEMHKLASCALERLGKKYGKIQKLDFPDRYLVTLRRETDLITIWDVNLVASDEDNTRVAISIPPKIGNVQPEQLFAEVETCVGPRPSGARAPG